MVVVKNVYTDIEKKRSFEKVLKRISKKKLGVNLYVVTYPLTGYGLLEIYDFNELLQSYYQKMEKITIIGMSTSKGGAKQLACEIIEDTYNKQHDFNIEEFMRI